MEKDLERGLEKSLEKGLERGLEKGLLWRAGLPALGGEAAPKPATAVYLKHRGDLSGAASRPNAGKPARHNKLHFPQ